MRNQANRSAFANDVLQNLQDLIQGASIVLCVQTAEAFIDEDRVEPNGPVGHLNNIRKTKRQGQGCDKGFAPRQRYDLTRPARLDIVNSHIEAAL